MEDLVLVEVNSRRVLLLSIVVLWLGMYLTKKLHFLQAFNIPSAVTGGLICSVVVAVIAAQWGYQLQFDLQLRDTLLLIFFSTIGLGANIKLLLAGGKSLTILLLAATFFLLLQNLVGISVSTIFEGHPAYGLLAGSVSFAGGHGTGITYGQLFEQQLGLPGTKELAMACATFGLIVGGLVGGPLAEGLIKRHRLTAADAVQADTGEDDDGNRLTNMNAIINATFVIAVCIGGGEALHGWLVANGITMPLYLPGLFIGILLTNVGDLIRVRRSASFENAISLWSDVSLTLFLAMSLMSMQLLMLEAALRPLLLVLCLQVLVMALFAYFVVFRLMGRDFDAAVISAGFAGLGLGATPVGMANMRAVTAKYGASAKAFLVIPLLGAFFIDIVNALVLQLYMSLPFFQ